METDKLLSDPQHPSPASHSLTYAHSPSSDGSSSSSSNSGGSGPAMKKNPVFQRRTGSNVSVVSTGTGASTSSTAASSATSGLNGSHGSNGFTKREQVAYQCFERPLYSGGVVVVGGGGGGTRHESERGTSSMIGSHVSGSGVSGTSSGSGSVSGGDTHHHPPPSPSASTSTGAAGASESDGSATDEYEIRTIIGYKKSYLGLALYWIFVCCTCGLGALLFRWYPIWHLKLTHRQCRTFLEADSVLVENVETGWAVEEMMQLEIKESSVREGYRQQDFEQSRKSTITSTSDFDAVSVDSYQDEEPILLAHKKKPPKPTAALRYFTHRMARYILDQEKGEFSRISGLSENDYSNLPDHVIKGLDHASFERRLAIFGPNRIDVPVHSYLRLLIEEVLNPFYIFQIFSIGVWISEYYYYYAGCIFVVSAISIAVTLVETKNNQRNLRQMALFKNSVTVVRSNGQTMEIESDELVPGDLLVIPSEGLILSCDAVLLSGKCIVNESMLTGESVPVTKSPLPLRDDNIRPPQYSPDNDKKYTLYCGTKIIQTRQQSGSRVIAMVVRTGFYTAKGFLVRSILYPKPSKFKFYREALRFVMFLSFLALGGFIFSLVVFVDRNVSANWAIIRAFDLVTVVVPPALPAAMTIGTVYAIQRLKKGLVYCISPPRVNVCGKLKMMCFDKTGTLTEDGLDVWGFVPIQNGSFDPPESDLAKLDVNHGLFALASCHSLTTVNTEIIGDPVDLKMFLATQWILEEPGEETERYDSLVPTLLRPPNTIPSTMKPTDHNYLTSSPNELGIVRQFHFSSHLQRMSVIVSHLQTREMFAYVKGSPEMLRDLCDPRSMPKNFNTILSTYTHQGFRVLAIAYKPLADINWLKAQRIKREDVESGLTMLGLLIMQNRLKPQTTPIINELRQRGRIRCAMVTGDNALTGISVARECHLVDATSLVFLGDTSDDSVYWTNIDGGSWQLNVKTLTPYRQQSMNLGSTLENSMLTTSVVFSEPIGSQHLRYSGHTNPASYFVSSAVNATTRNQPNFELAVTGKAFEWLRKNDRALFEKLLVRGTVFARMSPEHKTQLVEELQDIGYIVGFCGDGANDCGALKAAHVGVSLSEAEASVAAPFTFKKATIECIPFVIREGRGALTTSFSMFKFMALYSFIQFTTVLILRYLGSNLGDQQYLYFDLFMILIFATVMGRTGPAETLGEQRPPGSLVSPVVLTGLLVQIILVVVIQVLVFIWLTFQSWYIPVPVTPESNQIMCEPNTLLFFTSGFQYVIIAIIFSIGKPFRKPMYTNVLFMIALVFVFGVTLYFNIDAPHWAASDSFLQLESLPTSGKVASMIGGAVHFVLAYSFELFMTTVTAKKVFRMFLRKKSFKNKYKHIDAQLKLDYSISAIQTETVA